VDQYTTTKFPYGANSFVSYDSEGFPMPLLTTASRPRPTIWAACTRAATAS